MKVLIHKNEDRGHADYGWLKTKYSFSFANWYEPSRMGFGALRVINEDVIDAKEGFPMHSHANMEIVTIIMSGAVSHEDSIGNKFKVKNGEIQVMSAGTGVTHSEMNKEDAVLNLYQIWVEPNILNVKPIYAQKKLETKKDSLSLVVSGDGREESIKINQEASIYIGNFSEPMDQTYSLNKEGSGVYILMISGRMNIAGHVLSYGDAIGIIETDKIDFETTNDTKLLLFEVPLDS